MAEPKPILSRHLITEDLRTGGRGRIGRVWEADAVLSHHFRCRLWRRGWCTSRTSSDHLFGPQHELPPARLVIHRQTSAHERRKWTRSVQSRSCILAYLCTRQHWLWITVELHISGARHREAVAREGGRYAPVHRVSGSEPLSLRTHRHRGRSRPLRSAVVEYQAPSVAVWLQLCARTGLASGHSGHPVMQGLPQPTGPNGHVSGSLV